ncbi:hypothetical protein BC826DRAFT_967903 [Russula brevipes]|nr:hypothetical protein BC826DRAFT_967903 [Russula brevipes]
MTGRCIPLPRGPSLARPQAAPLQNCNENRWVANLVKPWPPRRALCLLQVNGSDCGVGGVQLRLGIPALLRRRSAPGLAALPFKCWAPARKSHGGDVGRKLQECDIKYDVALLSVSCNGRGTQRWAPVVASPMKGQGQDEIDVMSAVTWIVKKMDCAGLYPHHFPWEVGGATMNWPAFPVQFSSAKTKKRERRYSGRHTRHR